MKGERKKEGKEGMAEKFPLIERLNANKVKQTFR